MNRRLTLLIGCLLSSIFAATTFADLIHLKDGSTIEGEIRKSEDGWVVASQGKITHVTADKVASIELKPLVTADSAMTRLQSLRKGVEGLSDIKQVIERYQAFITQNHDTPAATEAESDVQAWRDRQAKGLVKVGDKWVTPAERDVMRSKSTNNAIDIHDLLKQGRYKEATPLIDRALAIDPQNPSLLYLRGVSQFKQDQTPQARKSFEQVIASLSDHAPTLNNLAVILWKQNAQPAALQYYDRAMTAAPGNRDILDNVLEAINLMSADTRKTPLAQKIVARFKEQDDDLQKRMKEKGQYRWGSTWVDEKQKAQREDEEKAVKDDMDKLQTDFDATQNKLTASDRRINEIQNMMATIQAASSAQTADGKYVQLQLPNNYFQYGRELDVLRQDQAGMRVSLDRMRTQAKQLKQKLPAPKFSGIQKLIDADGMPLPLPPATQPAGAVK